MIKVKKVIVVENNGPAIAKKGWLVFHRLLEFTIKQDDQA